MRLRLACQVGWCGVNNHSFEQWLTFPNGGIWEEKNNVCWILWRHLKRKADKNVRLLPSAATQVAKEGKVAGVGTCNCRKINKIGRVPLERFSSDTEVFSVVEVDCAAGASRKKRKGDNQR